MPTLKEIIQSTGSSGGNSVQSIQNAIHYIEMFQPSITPNAALGAHGIGTGVSMIGVHDVQSPLNVGDEVDNATTSTNFVPTTTTNTVRDLIVAGFQSGNRAVDPTFSEELLRLCKTAVSLDP
jgi:hypothetical protein